MYLETIQAKRGGETLDEVDITSFVRGIASGELSDSQIAAFAMAACINGMNADETAALTMAMAKSGDMIAWDEDELGGPVLDKHSSGGVGDKVSLLLAPIVAACGGYVPMVSGRGLGHTGGTLDKLEAIPGYQANQDVAVFRDVVKKAGCAIVSASDSLSPADKRLYEIRDVTATVDSVPLITASILSKKMAAGVVRLAMDIKVGNGAFMQDETSARELAQMITLTARRTGMEVTVLLSDMNEVLGKTAGCAVEVMEAMEILTGKADGDARLMEVTLELAGAMLVAGGLASGLEQGKDDARECINTGKAAEKMTQMVEMLGGDPSFMDDPRQKLRLAPEQMAVRPSRSGYVETVKVRDLGLAVLELGGGRKNVGDDVDHGVGLSQIASRGDLVGPGQQDKPLLVIHARDRKQAQSVASMINNAYGLADGEPKPGRTVLGKVS